MAFKLVFWFLEKYPTLSQNLFHSKYFSTELDWQTQAFRLKPNQDGPKTRPVITLSALIFKNQNIMNGQTQTVYRNKILLKPQKFQPRV